jgi:hypothetical protein
LVFLSVEGLIDAFMMHIAKSAIGISDEIVFSPRIITERMRRSITPRVKKARHTPE